jgi:hypothetical protein
LWWPAEQGATTEERESTTTLPFELRFYYPDPDGEEGPLCQRQHLGELDDELCTGREAGCLLPPVRSACVSCRGGERLKKH